MVSLSSTWSVSYMVVWYEKGIPGCPGNPFCLVLKRREGLHGSEDGTSEAALPVHGAFDPVQELGDLSVDAWLLATFLTPAHNPIDKISAIFFTGQRAPRVTLREES